MLSPDVLSILAGVSSLIGFLSLLAYFFFLHQHRKSDASVRETIEGEGLFNADQIIRLLEQFKDDHATRLEAMKELTKLETGKAKALLQKVDNNIQVTELKKVSSTQYMKATIVTAVFFIGLGGMGLFSALRSNGSDSYETSITSMYQNYNNGLDEGAERAAEEILRKNPKEDRALNILGGIAFYKQQYERAVEKFAQALEVTTDAKRKPTYANNLASAYIETGAYVRAFKLAESFNDGKPDGAYKMGMARLYAGEFEEARTYFEGISISYSNGAARISEAAAIIGLSKKTSDPEKREQLRKSAEQKLLEGYNVNREYWRNILTGKSRDKHRGSYAKPIALLNELIPSLN